MSKESVIVHRIVPNIYSDDFEKSKHFYTGFLGLKLVMDLGWIMTFASPANPVLQLSILQNDRAQKLNNEFVFLSVEVSDVDRLYRKAQDLKIPIPYKIANETWGVRRFFVKDPNGATINLVAHL